MTQRTLAGLLAVPLLIGLWVVAAVKPLPYVTYEPGLTIDVLGTNDGKEIIDVKGAKAYRDDGELRMTTVYVSQPKPKGTNNLFELMHDWISDEDAVYPYEAIYTKETTVEQNREEGAAEMTSSQDAATAVALEELGYDVTEAAVAVVTEGAPADGALEVGDVILAVDGTAVTDSNEVVDAVKSAPEGRPVRFGIERDGKRQTVAVTPETADDGKPQVGIQVGTQVKDDLPVDVTVNIDPSIGGPSAGLMFSLGIYDILSPGSMTGGKTIAGTGTMDAAGTVGPIGGIQQKIVGARDSDAGLFLVPPDNCADALGAPNGDMRLVKATTMHSARESIEAWVKDPDATLPSCKKADS
jgi:PDZ domain-containing protein